MRAKDSYSQPHGAQAFIDFLESQNGAIFKSLLYSAFRRNMNDDKAQAILDAACGTGWLGAKLKAEFPNIESCDGSPYFLEYLKKTFPYLPAQEVDLAKPLPYADDQFDTITFSMAAHDIENQQETFSYLARTLKPGGKLLMSIANPYYAAPVGVWKRSLLDKILGKKPSLKMNPYFEFVTESRNYFFNKGTLESYFYTLSEHINSALSAGFVLKKFEELQSLEDSPHFNEQYRMHRYPILLFMAFEKPRQ